MVSQSVVAILGDHVRLTVEGINYVSERLCTGPASAPGAVRLFRGNR